MKTLDRRKPTPPDPGKWRAQDPKEVMMIRELLASGDCPPDCNCRGSKETK